MSMPSDVTPDVMDAMEEQSPRAPSLHSRSVSQLTPEQKGWAVAALVAFLGVAFIGPAATRALKPKRSLQNRLARRGQDIRGRVVKTGPKAQKKMRRLGGGTFWH